MCSTAVQDLGVGDRIEVCDLAEFVLESTTIEEFAPPETRKLADGSLGPARIVEGVALDEPPAQVRATRTG
ncbi:MAG: hypothetical protein OXU19_17590 [bacterium]|nr:hypothetical protein [bacterium]MDE0242750.1 hypothetical protein [bacterium]